MTAIAVGKYIQQNRSAFLLNHLSFTLVGIDHGQGVVTIHPFCVHLIGIHSRTNAGCDAVTHGFAACLAAHAVLIVHDVDDHREATLHLSFPEFRKLIHCGKTDSLPYRAARHGRIANIGHYQSRLAIYLFVKGCSHSNIARPAHDSIVGIDTEGGKKGMHRPPQSSVKSGLTGKDLGQCTVHQKSFCEFFD